MPGRGVVKEERQLVERGQCLKMGRETPKEVIERLVAGNVCNELQERLTDTLAAIVPVAKVSHPNNLHPEYCCRPGGLSSDFVT